MPVLKLKTIIFRTSIATAALLLIGAGLLAVQRPVQAAQLSARQLTMADSRPGRTTEYSASMGLATAATLGSLRIMFCSDFAILDMSCTPPTGFDASGATIVGQTGVTDWVKDPSTTANEIILTRIPAAQVPVTMSLKLAGIKNPSTASSSFARFYVYPTADASGPYTDAGGLALSYNDDFNISTEVPPYITMCVAVQIATNDCSQAVGNFLQLGQLSAVRTASGQSQAVVATNAANGYTLRVAGGTMTSGNNVIPALTVPTASRTGVSQFGINLRNNSSPAGGSDPTGPGGGAPVSGYSQPDRFKYVSGDVIASNTVPEDYRKYTVTYIVNISRGQPPGVYSSSYAYIGLGNF